MAIQIKYLEFRDCDQWRNCLRGHHATEKEIYLAIYKKEYSRSGLSLGEATEEALCFGWIDSTLTPLDQPRYILRFSPRTANSIRSVNNISEVKK